MTTTKKTTTKKAAKGRRNNRKPAKAAPKADASILAIHINATGRVCFGKAAAARIGEMEFMTAAIDGKQVRLVASAKQTDGALLIRRANGRPYVSATKLLKPLGFDGTKALDIEAAAYNSHGFEFKVA